MLTKEEMPACPVATTVSLIGSKWKLLIIRNLLVRPWRFNELKKRLGRHQPESADGQSAFYGSRWNHHQNGIPRSAADMPFPNLENLCDPLLRLWNLGELLIKSSCNNWETT